MRLDDRKTLEKILPRPNQLPYSQEKINRQINKLAIRMEFYLSKKNKAQTHATESGAMPTPKLIKVDARAIQRAINKIAGTINNPEYQEQMTKLTQAAVTNSLKTLQKMTQISQRMTKLDEEDWENLINTSIDDLMRSYLQFNSDLVDLLQKLSIKATEILDKSLPEQEEKASAAN